MAISPEKAESCLRAFESYIDRQLSGSCGERVEIQTDRFFEGKDGRERLGRIRGKYASAGWVVDYDAPSPVPFDYGTLTFIPKKSRKNV